MFRLGFLKGDQNGLKQSVRRVPVVQPGVGPARRQRSVPEAESQVRRRDLDLG